MRHAELNQIKFLRIARRIVAANVQIDEEEAERALKKVTKLKYDLSENFNNAQDNWHADFSDFIEQTEAEKFAQNLKTPSDFESRKDSLNKTLKKAIDLLKPIGDKLGDEVDENEKDERQITAKIVGAWNFFLAIQERFGEFGSYYVSESEKGDEGKRKIEKAIALSNKIQNFYNSLKPYFEKTFELQEDEYLEENIKNETAKKIIKLNFNKAKSEIINFIQKQLRNISSFAYSQKSASRKNRVNLVASRIAFSFAKRCVTAVVKQNFEGGYNVVDLSQIEDYAKSMEGTVKKIQEIVEYYNTEAKNEILDNESIKEEDKKSLSGMNLIPLEIDDDVIEKNTRLCVDLSAIGNGRHEMDGEEDESVNEESHAAGNEESHVAGNDDEKIKQWLEQFHTTVQKEDGSYNIAGTEIKVTEDIVRNGKFAIKFGIITGNFNCSNLPITTLENGPTEVTGHYVCDNCSDLSDLTGIATKIDGYFSGRSTKIDSFDKFTNVTVPSINLQMNGGLINNIIPLNNVSTLIIDNPANRDSYRDKILENGWKIDSKSNDQILVLTKKQQKSDSAKK